METVCFSVSVQLEVPLNVAAKWLTLLIRILEVPSSNLCPETGYPDVGFSWFSSISPSKWGSILIRPLPLSSIYFPIYYSSYYPKLYIAYHRQWLYSHCTDLGRLTREFLFRQLVGLLWTSDQPVTKASTYAEQYNTERQRHASML
jgi:hypothetical protein